MSGELKNFPPSELKLERLRKAGVIAFADEVLTIGVIAGVLIGFWLLTRGAADGLYDYLVQQLSSTGTTENTSNPDRNVEVVSNELTGARTQLTHLLAVTVLPILICIVFLGMLQTRFLFAPGTLRIDFGRLLSLERLHISNVFGRLRTVCMRVILLIGWLIVSWLILRYEFIEHSTRNLDQLLTQKQEEMLLSSGMTSSLLGLADADSKLLIFRVTDAGDRLVKMLLGILAMSVLVGSGIYFAKILSFAREHRMTRSEVEDEYREMEAPAEFRTARSEFQQDGLQQEEFD